MTQPAPGSTSPGQMYVDLASREIWLGVDTSVDPNGSVLISDIEGILLAIANALSESATYTDDAIATRAPLVHTHTAAQITDFTEAVEDIVGGGGGGGGTVGPKGVIMYSGSLADIGVGIWAGWALCDGSNGTPDLRDKFVLGAGNKPVGTLNTLGSVTTSTAGAHTHVIDGTTLTIAQIPSHTHSVTGTGSGGTDASGDHAHSIFGPIVGNLAHDGSSEGDFGVGGSFTHGSGGAGNHAHNVSVNITGTAAANGGSGSHTHSEQTAGAHTHNFTSATLREAIPFYAAAFIMRL